MKNGTDLYRITGYVENVGEVKEYFWAFSEAQAILLTALKLEKQLKRRIFIEDAVACRSNCKKHKRPV